MHPVVVYINPIASDSSFSSGTRLHGAGNSGVAVDVLIVGIDAVKTHLSSGELADTFLVFIEKWS